LVPSDDLDAANGVLTDLDSEDGTVEEPEFPEGGPDIPNDVFAERRAGIPLKILVAAAIVAAIIVGLTISTFGPLDF
jgi:hypothetical protein